MWYQRSDGILFNLDHYVGVWALEKKGAWEVVGQTSSGQTFTIMGFDNQADAELLLRWLGTQIQAIQQPNREEVSG